MTVSAVLRGFIMSRPLHNQRSHVCSDNAPVFYPRDIRFEFRLRYIFVSLPRLTSEQERQTGQPDFFKSCSYARHEGMWENVWKHSSTYSKLGRKWRQVGFTQNKNPKQQLNRRIRGPWSLSGRFEAQKNFAVFLGRPIRSVVPALTALSRPLRSPFRTPLLMQHS